MKQYFRLQLKRILKTAPAVIALGLVLAVGFGVILNFVSLSNTSANGKQLTVAITGELEETFLSMGLTALSDFDNLGYSVDIIRTDIETAARMLESGKLSAYAVVPEGFAENAAHGDFLKIKLVTTPGAEGLVPLLKEELTRVISSILTHSHKGVYGTAAALEANSVPVDTQLLTSVATKYAELILLRDQMWQIENLGVAYSLTFSGYFFCGLLTVLLFLLGIVCSHLFVRTDSSLNRLLAARGLGASRQFLGEFLAYALLVWSVAAVIICGAYFLGVLKTVLPATTFYAIWDLLFLLIKFIPAVLLICSFHFAVYHIFSEQVSAIIFLFLFSATVGYISGCIFPIWFFPPVLQKIAPFTPIGAARGYIGACFSGDSFGFYFALALIFAALFIALGIGLRQKHILGREEAVI